MASIIITIVLGKYRDRTTTVTTTNDYYLCYVTVNYYLFVLYYYVQWFLCFKMLLSVLRDYTLVQEFRLQRPSGECWILYHCPGGPPL